MQLSLCVGILFAYMLGLPYEQGITGIEIFGIHAAWWRVVLLLGSCVSIGQVHSQIPCMGITAPWRQSAALKPLKFMHAASLRPAARALY
jgi:hypothetical protein